MNFNLNTPEGMANAITWTNKTMNMLKPGGTWVVPRSASLVTVVSHDPKECHILSPVGDPSIVEVLQAAGWSVK